MGILLTSLFRMLFNFANDCSVGKLFRKQWVLFLRGKELMETHLAVFYTKYYMIKKNIDKHVLRFSSDKFNGMNNERNLGQIGVESVLRYICILNITATLNYNCIKLVYF